MADNEKVRQEGLNSDQSRSKLKRRAFLGATVAALAAANGWFLWAKSGWGRPALKVVVDGPFADGAETSLESYKSNFVAPQSLRVAMRDPRMAKVNVTFAFKGTKDSSRKIRLDVVLRDVHGNTIGSRQLCCNDQRIRADKPFQYGSYPFTLSPENSENIKIALAKPTQIHSVEVTFQPI